MSRLNQTFTSCRRWSQVCRQPPRRTTLVPPLPPMESPPLLLSLRPCLIPALRVACQVYRHSIRRLLPVCTARRICCRALLQATALCSCRDPRRRWDNSSNSRKAAWESRKTRGQRRHRRRRRPNNNTKVHRRASSNLGCRHLRLMQMYRLEDGFSRNNDDDASSRCSVGPDPRQGLVIAPWSTATTSDVAEIYHVLSYMNSRYVIDA